jgi:hypothetical protein
MTHPTKQKIIDIFGKEPENLDEVAKAIIATARANGHALTGFAWQLHYKSRLSNSHSAPLDGVRNFTGQPHLPSGYPGLTGRIWIRLEKQDKCHFASDLLNETCAHPGSGGAGSYSGPWDTMYKECPNEKLRLFSYELKLWVSDWPNIERIINRQMLFPALKQQAFSYAHSFEWTDPEVLARDNVCLMLSREYGVHV